jgi:hypothetical protein
MAHVQADLLKLGVARFDYSQKIIQREAAIDLNKHKIDYSPANLSEFDPLVAVRRRGSAAQGQSQGFREPTTLSRESGTDRGERVVGY